MNTLENRIAELGLIVSKHTASTGSVYYLIGGNKFRISDHEQPSHYQMKNYFDVCSEDAIINIISNELFSFYANPIKRSSGFFNAIYNESTDTFSMSELNEGEYNDLIVKMQLKREFYKTNGFLGEILF